MSKVDEGLKRLVSLLPLKDRQVELGGKMAELHKAILHSFVENGRPINDEEIRAITGNDDVATALKTLQEKDLAVLNDNGKLVGSYPMTVEDTSYTIKVNGHEIHGMCALDSLGVSPMFGKKVQIESSCHATGEPISLEQDGPDIIEAKPSKDIHFGIIWSSPTGCCAHSLCTEMVFLKDKETATAWEKECASREVYNLDEAIEFSSRFFVPLVHALEPSL